MKKNIKKIFINFAFAIFTFQFFSCSSKNTNNHLTQSLVNLYQADEDSKELTNPSQKWHKSNKKTAILFGYGYNDADFVKKTTEMLFQKYGNAQENGNLISLIYPDDFKHGSKSYISGLANILDDQELSALIILGAPEGTYKAVTKLQDSYDGKNPFPVISLFSQDDTLGTEYISDIVIDKKQTVHINGLLQAEAEVEISSETISLLENIVFLSTIAESPLKKDSTLFDIVKMMAKNLKVSRYVDSETGLTSINHFVID